MWKVMTTLATLTIRRKTIAEKKPTMTTSFFSAIVFLRIVSIAKVVITFHKYLILSIVYNLGTQTLHSVIAGGNFRLNH